MSSIPSNNSLAFSNREVTPVPQRLPLNGSIKTIPYADSGGVVTAANDILNPALSADNTFRLFAPTYNGSLGSDNWRFAGGLFPNGPSDFNVFIGEQYYGVEKEGSGDGYGYPALSGTAEDWAGFAVLDPGNTLYPFSFINLGSVTVTAAGVTGDTEVYFVFQSAAYPNTAYSYTTPDVTILREGGLTSYVVNIPAQASGQHTFNNMLMYIKNKGDSILLQSVEIVDDDVISGYAVKQVPVWGAFGGVLVQEYAANPGDYKQFLYPGGSSTQSRILKLFGAGQNYPLSTGTENSNPINKDIDRYNLTHNTPPITHFTTRSNDLAGVAFPDSACWTSYRWCTFPGVDKDATHVEVGVWIRCPINDFFRNDNFGGFSVTFEKHGNHTTNQNQNLISHVAVIRKKDNNFIPDGAFPETVISSPASYFHNSTLSHRTVNGNYQTAFPVTKECKYHYFYAEDFQEFTKLSIKIPLDGFGAAGVSGDSHGIAVFDMYFAEATSYLGDVAPPERNSGSIEFFSPFFNNLDANGNYLLSV